MKKINASVIILVILLVLAYVCNWGMAWKVVVGAWSICVLLQISMKLFKK